MDYDFIAAPENVAFTAAAVVVLLLALIEVVGLLLAASPFAFLDDLFPDSDADVDADVGGGEASGLAKAVTWLNAGGMPTLVLLIILLLIFAIVGFALQLIVMASAGSLADGWLLALPAALASIFSTHALSRWVAKRLPRDQSAAVSLDSLIGMIADITIGPVRDGEPGRATLRDGHGTLHNLRVAVASKSDRFEVGEKVLLASRDEAIFLVTSVPESLLAPGDSVSKELTQ